MIFNLFKSKPTLRELIPDGFVDIHSHILPSIDDGAKNINESKNLIEEMKSMGFSKVIATPHSYPGLYDNTVDSIKSSFNEVKNINLKNINLDYAAEYMIGKYMINEAEKGTLLCLKDKYILVEMSYISPPIDLYEILFNLIHNGYKPILAHPERYSYYHNDYKSFYKLKKIGCFFQSNLLSFSGYYGNYVTKFAEKLLDDGLIDFTGSDVHKLTHISAFEQKVGIKNYKKLTMVSEKNEFFN